jgi:hypothetical protein
MRSGAGRPAARARLRSHRELVVLMVFVPAALVLSACGGSASPQSARTTSTSSSRSGSTDAGSGASTTTTTTSTALATTTTSAALATTMATLAVVACPTTYAISVTTTTTLPTSISVSVPAVAASNLVVYGDDNGIMMMIGPKGWTCNAAYGADGSGGLLISPAGESVPSDPDSGWHLPASSTAVAIVGYEVGVSPVQAAALACPLFSTAAAVYQKNFGHACTPHPTAESAAATGVAGEEFEDPAGVAGDGMPSGGTNPANGVLLYLPSWPGRSAAYSATCTLPANQQDVCTAVLNDFVGLYG